jgi:hypothetical protein
MDATIFRAIATAHIMPQKATTLSFLNSLRDLIQREPVMNLSFSAIKKPPYIAESIHAT